LTPSLLGVAGLLLAVFRFFKRPSVELGLLTGLLGAFGFGLVYMSLQVPSYPRSSVLRLPRSCRSAPWPFRAGKAALALRGGAGFS
jgi:hypothetical protein